jgi:hypothetical protein
MKTNRTILATLPVLALAAVHTPAALASGPLLSGYGGPGTGAQSIIGAALLNGPGGGASAGSGGGSGGGSSASSPTNSSTTPTTGSPSRSTGAIARGGGQVAKRNFGGGRAGAGRAAGTGAGTSAAGTGAGTSAAGSGASSSSSHRGVLTAAPARVAAPWLSGGDLLALALVAGVLALLAVATVRLAGAQRVH